MNHAHFKSIFNTSPKEFFLIFDFKIIPTQITRNKINQTNTSNTRKSCFKYKKEEKHESIEIKLKNRVVRHLIISIKNKHKECDISVFLCN